METNLSDFKEKSDLFNIFCKTVRTNDSVLPKKLPQQTNGLIQ